MIELMAIFTICIISGIFTGLLGIGGGLIIVPMFMIVLPLFGINLTVHQIVGISTTCVLLNSMTSLFYRRKEEFIEKETITPLLISTCIGTLVGAHLSTFAPDKVIFTIYIGICLASIFLMKSNIYCDMRANKLKPLLYLSFAIIGGISASIGIGGAILFATALKCFLSKTPKELLPTITLMVACHAVFAFLGKLANHQITLAIIPAAMLSSLIGSKIGIKISKKLSAQVIENLMIVVLIFALLRVSYSLLRNF